MAVGSKYWEVVRSRGGLDSGVVVVVVVPRMGGVSPMVLMGIQSDGYRVICDRWVVGGSLVIGRRTTGPLL
jgi:hypothetical protein